MILPRTNRFSKARVIIIIRLRFVETVLYGFVRNSLEIRIIYLKELKQTEKVNWLQNRSVPLEIE